LLPILWLLERTLIVLSLLLIQLKDVLVVAYLRTSGFVPILDSVTINQGHKLRGLRSSSLRRRSLGLETGLLIALVDEVV
jgi:hypothetical protein